MFSEEEKEYEGEEEEGERNQEDERGEEREREKEYEGEEEEEEKEKSSLQSYAVLAETSSSSHCLLLRAPRVLSSQGPGRRSARKLLGDNYALLSKREQTIAESLVSCGHGHLFSAWPPKGTRDSAKRALLTAAASSIDGAASDVEAKRLGA